MTVENLSATKVEALEIAGRSFESRLILGTGKYADAEIMKQAFAPATKPT